MCNEPSKGIGELKNLIRELRNARVELEKAAPPCSSGCGIIKQMGETIDGLECLVQDLTGQENARCMSCHGQKYFFEWVGVKRPDRAKDAEKDCIPGGVTNAGK